MANVAELNEFFFSKEDDKSKIDKLFFKLFKQNTFVPFFGSGLTKGEQARRGIVPSVDELSDKIIELMINSGFFQPKDTEQLKSFDLSKLSDFFWAAMEKNNNDIKSNFTNYVSNRFTRVLLSEDKKSVLECKWRYIYTLNYDDAIENTYNAATKDLCIIIPFDKINKFESDDYLFVYKIHGDAIRYISTGEDKYFIVSQRQYLKMIADELNNNIKENLGTDFASNDLIFFGCSLVNELDLILSAQTGLAEKKKMNVDTRCFFVKHIMKDGEKLDDIKKITLLQMGITDVIYVLDEEMNDFYGFIKSISDRSENDKTEFDYFTNFSFKFLEDDDRDNIDYLFSHKEYRNDKTIVLPSFFIRRDVCLKIIEDIGENNANVFVLRGSHFSGKSYILLDLFKEYANKLNVIYFKSGTIINDELFKNLTNKTDTLILFDENTIEYFQMNYCRSIETLNTLKKNNVKIVLAIDCSLGLFTKHFFEDHKNLTGMLEIYNLSSQLSADEIDRFNPKIGKLGLSDYDDKDTILDYVLKIDSQSICNNYKSSLPPFNIWNDINSKNKNHLKKIVKLFLLLSNQNSLTLSETIKMGIEDIVLLYCQEKDFPFFGIIQKEMLLEDEKNYNIHDSYRIISNSRYWIYRCLLNLVDNPRSYDLIAKVYYEIVYSLKAQIDKSNCKQTKKALYNKIKPYYFLDTIQQTFYKTGITKKTGSLSLPEKIYTVLLPLLNDDYQFMHQKAKCLLRKSRLYKRLEGDDIKHKKECLNAALQQINRAIELANDSNALNVEHTLFHMKVTKVLILINEWRYCNLPNDDFSKLSDLIKEYKYMISDYICYSDDIYDRELDEQEVKDVRWFVTDLMKNENVKNNLNSADRRLINEIVNDSNRKIFMKRK